MLLGSSFNAASVVVRLSYSASIYAFFGGLALLFRTVLCLPVTKRNTHGCEPYGTPEILKYDSHKFLVYAGD